MPEEFSAHTVIPAEDFEVPDGFTAHDGSGLPVDLNVRVQCFVTTSEGVGFSGHPKRAGSMGSWTHDQPTGLGHIIAYREVSV